MGSTDLDWSMFFPINFGNNGNNNGNNNKKFNFFHIYYATRKYKGNIFKTLALLFKDNNY